MSRLGGYGTGPEVAEDHFAAGLLGECGQVLHRFEWSVRLGHHDERQDIVDADGLHVGKAVRGIAGNDLRDCRSDVDRSDRVSVGLGLYELVGSGDRAGTGFVVVSQFEISSPRFL